MEEVKGFKVLRTAFRSKWVWVTYAVSGVVFALVLNHLAWYWVLPIALFLAWVIGAVTQTAVSAEEHPTDD